MSRPVEPSRLVPSVACPLIGEADPQRAENVRPAAACGAEALQNHCTNSELRRTGSQTSPENGLVSWRLSVLVAQGSKKQTVCGQPTWAHTRGEVAERRNAGRASHLAREVASRTVSRDGPRGKIQIRCLWEKIPRSLQAHRGEPGSLSRVLVRGDTMWRTECGWMHLDIRGHPQWFLPLILGKVGWRKS